jgi:hypothetical protein
MYRPLWLNLSALSSCPHPIMPTFPARRLADIAPFHVMELLARARALEAQGRDIIHMEVGEPDFPTPEPIIAAARASIEDGRVFYTAGPWPARIAPGHRRLLCQTRYAISVPAAHCGNRRRLGSAAAGDRLPRRAGQRMAAHRSRLSVQSSHHPKF